MNRRRWGILIFVVAMIALAAIAFVATASEKMGKAFLGIVPGEVTSDLALEYGVAGGAGNGIMVDGVSSDTPAEKAGLRENDVIVRLNGSPITGPQELRNQLSKLKPGDAVDIVYLRAGKEKSVNVKLGQREEDSFKIFTSPKGHKQIKIEGAPWEWGDSKKGEKTAFAGIVTQGLSDGLAQYFKVESGALISEVVKDSPAEKAGLKAGDVITKIGDEKIEDEGDVRSAIQDHKPGDGTDFTVKRDGQETVIKVTLGEHANAGNHFFHFGDATDGSMGYLDIPDQKDMDELRQSLKGLAVELKDIDINTEDMENLKESLKSMAIELKDVPDSTIERLKELKIPNLKIKVKKDDPTPETKKSSSHLRMQVMGTFV
jgi:serine protease Do